MSLLDMVSRQHQRLLRLSYPNNDGPAATLLVNKIEADEALSTPFDFTVELLSDDPNIALTDLQGKLLCVELVRRDGSLRYFTGRVFGFALKTVDGGVAFYQARLGPWYQYLSMRKDNYLFHNTSMYEQTDSIFGDYGGLAEWDWQVQGASEVFTDCCQFDESDRNFLERRWAAAGIVYWFEHSASGHKLVLTDDTTLAAPIDGTPDIALQRQAGTIQQDGMAEWSPGRRIAIGSVALASFDFKAPHPAMTALPTLNQQGDVPNIESYEYAGALGFKAGAGRPLAQLRMEEAEAAGQQFNGSGDNRSVMPGRWFRLGGHYDGDAGGAGASAREFLITAAHHSASNNYHVTATAESHYENRLAAIRKVLPWRAGRHHGSVETKIHGVQTATVVGPAGEEIHTDEYGRVRVQFHWDRAGSNDEKSSAWIRVATPWAGANFGMTSIPRIGSEVLVMFLDGSPNRPIITGMVPNAATMPPWTLPVNKTQSGILTRSTPGGSYDTANALRFEDKKGQEQLWLHAEKDLLNEVEHDADHWVGNDRRETVDHDEKITIHNNREERVDHDEVISIGDNRTEDVGKNETISVGGDRTKSVDGDETDSIGKSWTINVARMKTETINMASVQNVGMGRMDNVGLGYNLNVGMVMATVVGVDQITKVGNKVSISAGDEISLTVGKASLTMKSDGTIMFNGHTFSVGTSDEQSFVADGDITIKGKKILEN